MSYFLTFFVLLSAFLTAKDLGTYGETFPIQEDDFIEILKKRLAASQFDENKKLELQKTFVKTIETPKGKMLPKAKKLRSFEFDPTLRVYEDIKDQRGSVIIRKGTRINPLDTTPMHEDLLFFDGNDLLQLEWAKNLKGKWILTNGNPLEIEDHEKRPVYFDQAGYLIRKLEIRSLPAKVTQKGNKLRIEEIPCF